MWKVVLFAVGLYALGWLPLAVLYRLASLAAEIVYVLRPKIRRNVWSNLCHIMPPGTPKPEMRAAARQVFRNVALYYADLAHMPRMRLDDFFRRRLVFHGFYENLLPAIKAGNGVIVLSAHCGNPELAVQGLLPLGVRVLALTEPLKPPRLSRLVDRIRASKGHDFAPVSVGSVKRTIRVLRSGGVVALMGDRDIEGPRDVFPFFGAEAPMPTGPIEVAIRTGAAVIPSFSRRRDTYNIEVFMEPPLEIDRTGDTRRDVRTGSQRFLERLERHLRADPGQWAVLEPVWDLPGPTAAEPASAAGRAA